MRFGSVCSGIEAASVAWEPLGWQAAWFSEIEPFPSAVLAHHYPNTPNHGDMTTLPERVLSGEVEAPDLLCGGTPCQAFSVAGLRRSLDDARGNLSLTFCELADAIDTVRSARGQQPAIVFWENVPGVLSTADNAFGCFLGRLVGSNCELQPAGKRWTDAGCVLGSTRAVAWRILDAQYFGLAQRRRRVFVVASARSDLDPATVLFESEGVRRDTAPSRQARQDATASAASGAGVGSVEVAGTLGAHHGNTRAEQGLGVFCLSSGQANAEVARDYAPTLNCLHEAPVLAHAFDARQSDVLQYGDKTGPLDTDGHSVAVRDVSQTLTSNYGKQVDSSDTSLGPNVVFPSLQVRRLTPRECERLQGFPDDYTAIRWRGKSAEDCPDGPRYKALGNSWAVPVVRWIGRRIAEAL